LEHRSENTARFALKAIAFATACLWGTHASALGLGRLNVQSALGESLKAEIEVTSITAEEASSLRLRVAPPDAYRAAGVEYNPVLPSAQVRVARRGDGSTYLRVTSDRAVLEPFIDVIVEATWSSGRLVREYTMLFDPPTRTAQQPATAPIVSAAPAAAAQAPAPQQAAAPQAAPPAPVPMTRPAAPARSRALSERERDRAPAQVPVQRAATSAPLPAGGEQYRVKPGESLSRIASRTAPSGISLDQMLVSLFRGNPQAFIGDNMNRLKAGSVLQVPSVDQAGKLSPQQAREVILAQSSDFGGYRQRLASGVPAAPEAASSRQAKGQVQAQVDDRKSATAATPDRLTLSQGGVKPGTPEAKVTKEAEKKDDKTRLAELNRNVEELKKLQGSTATAPATAAPATTVAAPAAQPAPAPVVVPGVAPGVAPAVAPVAAPAPVAAAVASAALPAPAAVVAPTTAASKPAIVKAPSPAPAAQGGGFMDSLLDNALLLPGAGVLVALLAGLGLYKLRGRMRKPAGETSFLESRLQPDSFFGASGGQRIDTRDATMTGASGNSSSMSYSMSQLDAIGDVDPVAEADVYLAYGRDLQAEEILKEAMRATPERMAIRTKLLEVYAKRRDIKAFELLATQVYNLTRGEGEDWSKVQALGSSIDPTNEMYVPGGEPEGSRSGNGMPLPDALGAATQPYTAPVAPPTFQPAPDATLDGDLDLNLDLDLPAVPAAPAAPAFQTEATQPYTPADRLRLDDTLDLSADSPDPATVPIGRPAGLSKAQGNSLDFDLGALDVEPKTVSLAKPPAAKQSDSLLDFGDFDLGDSSAAPADESALARKLELAEEFRQIGDIEGARDLLEEVAARSEGALKAKAQGMLSQLARR
jgi:pilus assembly protein FimV